MDVLLTRAAAAGFDHGVVVVRAEIEEAVAEHLERFPPHLPVAVVVQPVPHGRSRPLGTAHAVLACRDVVDGPCAVMNADDLYPAGSFAMLASHLRSCDEHV